MKLLVVSNDFPPKIGGADTYVADIVARWPAGEATVLTSQRPGADAFDRTFPHPVIRVTRGTLLPTPSVRRTLEELVRREQPACVVFGAALPLATLGAGIERRCGVPFATFTHGLEVSAARFLPGRWFLRQAFRRARLVTAVSEWSMARLSPLVPAGRLAKLSPGVDVDMFRPDGSGDAVRKRHQIGDGPVIVCVSRLVARKGQDHIIRALPSLLKNWPALKFLIVGVGPHEAALRTLARDRHVEPQVIFAGAVPRAELPAHLCAGDIFAMPARSRWRGLEAEAFGISYLEAAACGRVVVAGRTGGTPESVKHGETGIVVDGDDPQAIEATLRELLENPDRAKAMGAAGAQWIRREHTWTTVTSRLRLLLEDALRAGATLTPSEDGSRQS